MNIKSERVHALAKEAARVSGRSQTSAVEEGLRLLLAEYGQGPATERSRRLDAMRGISLAWQPDPEGAATLAEVDDLYDGETGLPQ